MLVHIAKCRALPASERAIGQRHRNRDIYAHHPDLNPARECPDGVAGEEGHAVAVLGSGGQGQRRLEPGDADHPEGRAEDFILVSFHGHPVEQRAAEAALLALQLNAAAVLHRLGTVPQRTARARRSSGNGIVFRISHDAPGGAHAWTVSSEPNTTTRKWESRSRRSRWRGKYNLRNGGRRGRGN
jgi:hypothetical protein